MRACTNLDIDLLKHMHEVTLEYLQVEPTAEMLGSGKIRNTHPARGYTQKTTQQDKTKEPNDTNIKAKQENKETQRAQQRKPLETNQSSQSQPATHYIKYKQRKELNKYNLMATNQKPQGN